jgi:hypothetical protein
LNSTIVWLDLERPLHVPDRAWQILHFSMGFGQPGMSNEIFGVCAQDPLKYVNCIAIIVLLEKHSPEKAIRGYMTGLLLKDKVAVCSGFLQPVFIQ